MLDIIIIGAGLSGLTAARSLRDSGRSVQVIEARQRSGGRAYSPSTAGHRLDLGPTWVWDSESSIHGLLRTLHIDTFAHRDAGQDVYESQGELQRGRFPRSTVPSRRIVGGVQSITDALLPRAGHVQYGTPVTALEPVAGGLRVVTSAGEHTARGVLAAVPPSLLAPLVEPLEHERAELLAHVPVWMGDIAKVVMVFERPFWEELGWSGRGASSRGPMVEIHDMSGPEGSPACLFGFVPEAAGNDSLDDRIREQLIRMFGDQAVPQHIEVLAWWQQPHTTRPLHRSDPQLLGHHVLRQPLLGGRLHMISCETSGRSPGHLDGAVERAQAVCAQLLETP